ncbi:MAG: hypothetical protein DCC71_01375 [Proteobacteria bacterium]|nr:MAG: hypothetical protein DCC71_01375 [Pseudomonadota bacterium]
MDRSFARADRSAVRRAAPLALLLAVAAAWRAFQWSRTVSMFNDGPLFLDIARAIAAGDGDAVLGQPHHPLYSLLVAAVHGLGVDWETAGAAVSIAGGTAAVGLAFWLLRDLFGEAPAWLGASLLAVHARAVEYSSDVQTDGIYLACFLAAAWWLWRAWSRRSLGFAAAAGLASGLAYLARPEGVALVGVAGLLASASWLRDRWPAGFALRWLGTFAIAAALCAAPYVIALQHHAGSWSLTHKKSVAALLGAASAIPAQRPAASPAPAAPAPARAPALAAPPAAQPGGRLDRGEDGLAVVRADSGAARSAASAKMLARTAKSAFRYGPLALLAMGLVAARGRPTRRAWWIASLLAVYGALLYALTFQMGYVSRRHALPPLVPLFGYVGLGAIAMGAAIARVARRGPALASALAIALVALVAAGEIATQREPRRAEERAARAAAEWLREHAEPAPLAVSRLRLGYYAGMPYIRLTRVDDASFQSFLEQSGARYLLLDDPADVEAARRVAGDQLRPLHRAHEGGRDAWVFERVGWAAP